MAWQVAQMIGMVILVWLVVMLERGADRAWIAVAWALGGVLVLLIAVKAYAAYFSWSFGRKLSRMSPADQAAEMNRVMDDARQLLKESKPKAEPANAANRR